MNQFVFTGPESTGKTTLASFLAKESNGIYVAEYAREYLLKYGKEYKEEDLLNIAKKQFENQEKAKAQSEKNVFMDTDLITIKVWSEYKYGRCDRWILDRVFKNINAIYFLCKPDFEWQFDSLRENPNETERKELYAVYKDFLDKNGFNYIELEGSFETREEKVKGVMKSY